MESPQRRETMWTLLQKSDRRKLLLQLCDHTTTGCGLVAGCRRRSRHAQKIIIIIVVRQKIKSIKNKSKILDNQGHDFVFQKVSPLIKKELSLPRSTRVGPAKSRGGGAVNDKQLSGSCKTACRFLVLLEPLSGLAERAAFFLP